MKSHKYLLIIFLSSFITLCFGQSQQDSTKIDTISEPVEINAHILDNRSFDLILYLIGFSSVIIVSSFILAGLKESYLTSLLKVIISTLIVTSVMVLVIAGYSTEQIAPAYGVLGTLAGYLLGKNDENNK